MNDKLTIWTVLGIEETADVVTIRRAYAKRLKEDRPDDAQSFQRLRSAYEMALRYAHQKAQAQQAMIDNAQTDAVQQKRIAATTEVPSSQAAAGASTVVLPDSQPIDELNTQLNILGHSFQQLYQSLKGRDEQAARKCFDEILRSSALERIDVERRVEYEMANLLASTLPASDALLDSTIKRFGWDKQIVNTPVTPAMAAILNRRKDLDFRRIITYSGHPYRDAYEGLRTKTLAPIRWVKAHYHLFGRATEHQLLQHIRREYPSLISDFDPQIVSWLDKMANRPQPSFVLISALFGVLILSFLVSLYGLFLGTTTIQKVLYAQLQIFGVGAAVICMWLVLIDWPRWKVRKRWPMGVSWYLRIGWVAVLVAVLLASAMAPGGEAPFISILLLTGICAIWSVIVTERFWVPGNNFSSNILIVTIFTNIPLLYWGVFLGEQIDTPTLTVMSAPIIAVMTLSVITAGSFAEKLLQKMTSTQRAVSASVVLLSSALTIKGVWEISKFTAYYPLCIALTFTLVAISRPFNCFLSSAQRVSRMIVGFLSCAIFFSWAESPDIYVSNVTIMGGAFAFSAMTFISMSMLIFNEISDQRVKSRLRR